MTLTREAIESAVMTEEFTAEISKAENTEDIRKAFAAAGLELTEEEAVSALGDIVREAQEQGELDEEELSGVAGGCSDKFSHTVSQIVFYIPNKVIQAVTGYENFFKCGKCGRI